MYRLFTLYWSGQRAMGFVDAHTRFTRMEAPRIIDPALLPREYMAVKFYAARSLPDTPLIRAQLRSMVASIARDMPVVLLDTGLVLEDDHADYAFDSGAQIVSARPWMTPQNNLGVQTQIAAGRQGVRRHVRQHHLAGAAARRGHLGCLRRSEVAARAPAGGHARCAQAGRRALRRRRPAGPGAVASRRQAHRGTGVKVVFIARHFTYFRNFESVITALAERGHSVHLAADREEALGGRELVDRVAARPPSARHRGVHADPALGPLPATGRRAAARPRLPALFRSPLRHHAQDPRTRLRPHALLRAGAGAGCRPGGRWCGRSSGSRKPCPASSASTRSWPSRSPTCCWSRRSSSSARRSSTSCARRARSASAAPCACGAGITCPARR